MGGSSEEAITINIEHGLTGMVLQQFSIYQPLLVEDIQALVASAAQILSPQVLLTLAGRPLCSYETLVDLIDGSRALELSFRKTDPEWLIALEEVGKSSTAFDLHSRRHREQLHRVLKKHREQSALVGVLASDMKDVYSSTLAKVSACGDHLLIASGDLQRNRDVVFDLVPRTAKGTRRAAEELKICRESVLEAVKANGATLTSLNDTLNPSKKAVLIGLRESAAALQKAQEVLRREGELVHLAKARGWLSADAAAELENQYRTMLQSVSNGSSTLLSVADEVRKCREAYRITVTANGNAVKNAVTSLTQDQDVVFPWVLEHVSERRKCNRDFILATVQANGESLERVPAEFKRDLEIVMAAIKQSDGWALQFADPELQRDRQLVLMAVRWNGFALEHAAQELQEDYEVVMTAVQVNGEALEHAAENLRNDREIVLAAVRRSNGFALQSASKAMQRDRAVVLAAIAQNGMVLEHVSEDLRDDTEVVTAAVQGNGLALEHAAENMRSQREVVLAAVHQTPLALQYASAELRGDREVVASCIRQDGTCLMFASEELRRDRALVLSAIHQSGTRVLEFAAKEFTEDEGIMQESLTSRTRELKAEREAKNPSSWTQGPPDACDEAHVYIVNM